MSDAGETTAIRGRVIDPSGGVVVGATVRLGSLLATTDRQGAYRFHNLRPGTRQLMVLADGFEPWIRKDVEVRRGQTITADVKLRIHALAEQITVKAPALEGEQEVGLPQSQEWLEFREVRESSAKDVGEALARLGAFWKIRKGGIANDVVLRGFQQGNLNVLIDGARIYGACPNHMDPAAFHVDFSEIQQVEVTKGPFDIRNQGSLGGSLNIVTKRAVSGLHITPNISVGSFGYYNPSISGSIAGERYSASGGYSYRVGDSFRDGRGNPFTAYANYRDAGRPMQAFDAGTGWARVGASGSNRRFNLNYTRQATNGLLYPYLLMDAGYDNADRVTGSYEAGQGAAPLRVLLYFTRVKHWMTDELRTSSSGAPQPFSMATFAGTRTLGGRLDKSWGGLHVGAEAYRRTWNAVTTMLMTGRYMDQASIPNVDQATGGAYAAYETNLGMRARLSAGMRFDAAALEARSQSRNMNLYWAYKGTSADSASYALPSGNVSASVLLFHGLNLFAGFGATARFPDPQESFFALRRSGADWVGNPSLRPTQNREVDAGLQFRSGRWMMRSTFYYSVLADFITVQNQPLLHPAPGIMNVSARSYANVGARIYGGELASSVGLSQSLMVSGGVSWTRGSKDIVPSLRIYSPNMAEMPPLKSYATLRYGRRLFFAETGMLASAAQNRVDTDLREQRTSGFTVFGAKVGIHANKLTVAAGADNLLNRFYYEAFSYQRDPFRSGARVPEPGRALFVNASYAF